MPLEGRKEGRGNMYWTPIMSHRYLARHMSFHFLICLIITLQSKNPTHIKDEKLRPV